MNLKRTASFILLLGVVVGFSIAGIAFLDSPEREESRIVVDPRFGKQEPNIVHDPRIDSLLGEVASDFLARSNYQSLSCSIMYKNSDGSWTSGGYREHDLRYPASVAKLAALPGMLMFLRQAEEEKAIQLENDLPRVFKESDNEAFGRLIDLVTGTENYVAESYDNSRFDSWFEKRSWFEKVLDSYGLLENQKLRMKTYPSNESDMPRGAEGYGFEMYGGNRLRTDLSNTLMLHLTQGYIEPEYTEIVRSLLWSERLSYLNIISFALPPGVEVYNKVGFGVGRYADTAWVVMPNGKEFILSVSAIVSEMSTSYDPMHTQQAILSVYTRRILEELEILNHQTRFAYPANGNKNSAWRKTGEDSLFPTLVKNADGVIDTLDFEFKNIEEGEYELIYSYAGLDKGITNANLSAYLDKNGEGFDRYTINLSHPGNRWFRLGVVKLPAGNITFRLSQSEEEPGFQVGLSAVGLSKLP